MSWLRLIRTVRHLRPVQIYGRLWNKLYHPAPDVTPAAACRVVSGKWIWPAERRHSMTGSSSFFLLNEARLLKGADDWDSESVPRLWRYNVHYFDDLNAAKAAERVQWHHALVERWVAENQPGQGIGWEPYPTSLRIVNWVKWALKGNRLAPSAIDSLAVQARWLRRRIEIHLLGNHLFANAKALIFAGLFFEGAEAEAWLRKGLALVARELPVQILSDGGHFELSPMYHAILLEDMLDLVNLHRAHSRHVELGWNDEIAKMRRWLSVMCHPDGEIPFFNDAALGIAIAPAALEAYARRLGYERVECPGEPVISLPDSGYMRVAVGSACAFLDLASIGPDYLPAHAHADTLSFELSIGGQRVLVNSGTSEYGAGAERLRQRGTGAHNTLRVDGQDSSEIWAGFRVGRRARVTADEVVAHTAGCVRVYGAHDGYRHLPGSPTHRREWKFAPSEISISDEVTGAGEHQIEVLFHIHATCSAARNDEGEVSILDSQGTVICVMAMDGAGELGILPSTYHPEFGVALDNQLVSYRWVGSLPMRCTTHIRWNQGSSKA